jgi:hypothetical protein
MSVPNKDSPDEFQAASELNQYAAPQSSNSPPDHSSSGQGDATGGVIPYKNPHALIAYYLGIFSLLPVVGLPLGIIAIGLGISGLTRRKRNPIIKGSAHAIIGIVLGFIQLIYNGLIVVSLLVVLLGRSAG